MAMNLVDQVKSYLTPDVIQKAASYVGESESTTQKAMGSIVPALVAALSQQASTTSGAQQLVGLLDAGKYDGNALTNVSSLFSGGATTQSALGAGQKILDALFGSKLTGAAEVIGRFAGLRTASASSLLTLAARVVI
jgi:hypothetical protein